VLVMMRIVLTIPNCSDLRKIIQDADFKRFASKHPCLVFEGTQVSSASYGEKEAADEEE
jgi:hypothetical protein